jgi:tRNA uridine 5-carboxymethylaminomethyl modification enzyme
VTKGTREPYRLFTSRAEYRLLLREDNADARLLEWGFDLGLVEKEALERFREKQRLLEEEEARLQGRRLLPTPEVNRELEARGTAAIKAPTPVLSLLKRPQVDLATLYRLSGEEPLAPQAVVEQLEIKHKYEGYIQRQEAEAKKFAQGEGKSIPPDFDYDQVPGLSLEIREKLNQVRPRSLGQAARVSGVTPAALAILMVYLKRRSSLRNQQGPSCES